MKSLGASILYDAPGPKARRFSLIVSIITSTVVLIGAYFLIYKPLADQGQFTAEKWGPLLDPSNAVFSQVWSRIGFGARQTLFAAGLAITFSLLFGTLLAVLRVQLRSARKHRFATNPALSPVLIGSVALGNGLTRVIVEIFRGIPVVITVFFVARLGPSVGFNVDNPMWYLVIGLTIYNMIVLGEILRSGMTGLPGGQAEAAAALGLSTFQTTRMILLPQAFRLMMPALISQLIVVLKDTSLGFLISYEEVLNVGKQLVGVLDNPLQMYAVIGVLFILVNYALSKLAHYVQHRLERRRDIKPGELPHVPPSVADAELL